jgi:hypothetical protein
VAIKNQSFTAPSLEGILESLIARDILRICRYVGCLPVSIDRWRLSVLAIRSWCTVGRASRTSANVVAFDPEVREYRSHIPVSHVAQKPQFHMPRNCLIRHAPISRLCLPNITRYWAPAPNFCLKCNITPRSVSCIVCITLGR